MPQRKMLPNIQSFLVDAHGSDVPQSFLIDLTKTGAELLFEVFSQRYERGAILVTTNLPFDEWTEVFGSERLTGALLDRLTHRVHILEMNGESYRLKQSRLAAATRSAGDSPDAIDSTDLTPRLTAPADARRRVIFSLNIDARLVHFCSAPWC